MTLAFRLSTAVASLDVAHARRLSPVTSAYLRAVAACPEPSSMVSVSIAPPAAASELGAGAALRISRPRPVRGRRPLRSVDIVADDDCLLNVHEAAAFLGVMPRTLYKWAAQGQLPVVHLGRAVRFRMGALRARVREAEEATPSRVAAASIHATVGTERAAPTRR